MFVGRSGFSRDLCAIENQGFRVAEAAFIATLCVFEDRGSGLKSLLQKPPFVGAASTATLQDRGDEGCLLSLSDPFRGVSCRITTCNCPAILGRISQPSAELRNAVRTPPLFGTRYSPPQPASDSDFKPLAGLPFEVDLAPFGWVSELLSEGQ